MREVLIDGKRVKDSEIRIKDIKENHTISISYKRTEMQFVDFYVDKKKGKKKMINKDMINKNKMEIFEKMSKAAAENNKEEFLAGYKELSDLIQESVLETAREEIKAIQEDADRNVLAARGVRQLTSEETKYYEKVIEALRSGDPKQAIANLDIAMPETIINSVFEELRTDHPLLSKIDFTPTTGLTRMLLSDDLSESAQWGKLCDDIIKRIVIRFKRSKYGAA